MWILSAAVALAGSVYVNGTFVEPRSLAGVSLDKATIRFDAQGNIYIDAPGYQLQMGMVGQVGPAPVPNPRPPTIAPPAANLVTYGRWWLVVEDSKSSGHTVDIWINDQLATTVRSGDGGKLVELSRWLRLGANNVIVKSSSTNPTGGIFAVYLGAGGAEKGAFDMPAPVVNYELGSSRTGPYQREYNFTVDK
jgi:hypothetical protein